MLTYHTRGDAEQLQPVKNKMVIYTRNMLYNMLYTLGKPVVPLQIKQIVLSEKHTNFLF